jgi:F-type H+-transporting ATPase subunit a
MAAGLPHPVLLIPDGLHAIGIDVPIHVSITWFVMFMLFIVSCIVGRNLKMVPGTLQNLFEIVIGGLEDFVVVNVGEKGREVFHVLAVIFIFILPMNLIGLVPGFDAPTANINTNAAMALFLFGYYNYIGLKKWGPGYIKHFMGPIGFLAPVMIILELISHLARPLSLTLRLFGNIKGEEIVLILMFALAPIAGSLPMYFLFMLAKTIQAFIFFMLGMIYLKGSLEHAH